MEAEAYELMASHEAHHWWFRGRRAVVRSLIQRMELPDPARILEAGCGTGGNLAVFESLGSVAAFEPYEPAASIAQVRYPSAEVREGSLPDLLPFDAQSFDLVAALDVLEHIDDDAAALEALISLTKLNGYLVLTVPTHPFLWGTHDRRLHHKRRYHVADFWDLCRRGSVDIVYFGPFNTLLAAPAIAIRVLDKLLPIELRNQERLPPRLLNSILSVLFEFEGYLTARGTLPFGLSHAAVLHRKG